jgi:hypothetical protein
VKAPGSGCARCDLKLYLCPDMVASCGLALQLREALRKRSPRGSWRVPDLTSRACPGCLRRSAHSQQSQALCSASHATSCHSAGTLPPSTGRCEAAGGSGCCRLCPRRLTKSKVGGQARSACPRLHAGWAHGG